MPRPREEQQQLHQRGAVRKGAGANGSTKSMQMPMPSPTENAESISFACAGWLKMYLFGVAKALQEAGVDRDANVIGCSGGALAATALALGCNMEAIRDHVVKEMIPRAREPWAGPFQIRTYCAETLAAVGHLDRYEQVNTRPSKLTVVYSSLSALASRRITHFDSKEHLLQCLLASCCAVPIGGMPFKLKGEWVVDGGLFDIQPVIDANTITVSPFYCTAADIKPSRYVPMWWAVYPPCQRDVKWLFDLGYEDGLNWVVKNGRTPPGTAITIPTRGATYDGQWTTTVGRFFGYRGLESRVFDLLFVALFVCLWRPIAFTLLYVELCLQTLVSGGKAALFAAASKFAVSSIVLFAAVASLAMHNIQESQYGVLGLLTLSGLLGMVVLYAGGIHEASSLASKDWQKCQACLRNLTSLSLFLRSVPVYGSSITIKRHDHLVEHSLVYRLALHCV